MCDCWFIRSEFFFKAWFPEGELCVPAAGWSVGDCRGCPQPPWLITGLSSAHKAVCEKGAPSDSRICELARASPSSEPCRASPARGPGSMDSVGWCLAGASLSHQVRAPLHREPTRNRGPAVSVTLHTARPSGNGAWVGRKLTFHGFWRVCPPFVAPGRGPGISLISRSEGSEPAHSAAPVLLKWISSGRHMQSDLIFNKTNRNRLTDLENELTLTRGEGWDGEDGLGVRDWHAHTALYWK